MRTLEILRFAVSGLLTNKLRSLLTVLGIFIGVGAVILLTAVGQGAQAYIQGQIRGLGTNSITLTPSTPTNGKPGRPLTSGDAAALADRQGAPDVATVSPVVTTSTSANADGTTDTLSISGSLPSYIPGTNATVELGRPITDRDVTEAAKVLVLNRTAADTLYGPSSNPVGRTVLLNNIPFAVVGVLKAQDAGPGGSNDTGIAPLTAVQSSLTGYGNLNQIVAVATSAEAEPAAESEITSILNRRHGITSTAGQDYRLISSAQLLSTLNGVLGAFTLLLAAIAAISLVVGGIGITNIMLVSVTERTREIGIRKAIGAPPSVILGQFLAEATILSLFGGALGVALGYAGTLVELGGFRPVVLPSAVALAVGVSAAIGVFFGGYPALRAARLAPIEALRRE